MTLVASRADAATQPYWTVIKMMRVVTENLLVISSIGGVLLLVVAALVAIFTRSQ